jgi:thiamine-monophosphate kinase
LAIDLARLAAASNCGAVTYVDRLPIAPGAWELAQREAPDRTEDRAAIARQHALGDGEDFELLLAVPPDVARTILQDQPVSCGITHVGKLIDEMGLWQQGSDGERRPLEPIGWLH